MWRNGVRGAMHAVFRTSPPARLIRAGPPRPPFGLAGRGRITTRPPVAGLTLEPSDGLSLRSSCADLPAAIAPSSNRRCTKHASWQPNLGTGRDGERPDGHGRAAILAR